MKQDTSFEGLREAHLHHCIYVCLCSGAFWKNLGRILEQPTEVSYCSRGLPEEPRQQCACARGRRGVVAR
eukprot:NODE_34129_length_266_cov_3.215827.p3 GENE.NODE_34129_length_266_cov_3.215827~~NODE_34129_length_266_cov_3.215827.p3  ORF type:complete len:70 (+),score=11.78 NODE_34129_length_266_cov_3.215827:3-212(+)